jgi:hypothetical protein
MNEVNVKTAYLILSHNDSDHVNLEGVDLLMKDKRFHAIYTELLFKHAGAIEKRLGDDRRNRKSIIEAIGKRSDNVKKLEKYSSKLRDIYKTDSVEYNYPPFEGIKFVGPAQSYMIKVIAHALDGNESDNIDGESCHNAACVQVEVTLDNGSKMLLTGDSCFEAFDEKVNKYQVIQLPHHGKDDTAQQIFDAVKNENTVYFVSDNKGNAKGGSSDSDFRGQTVLNTKNGDVDGNQLLSAGVATYRGAYSAL